MKKFKEKIEGEIEVMYCKKCKKELWHSTGNDHRCDKCGENPEMFKVKKVSITKYYK